MFNLLFPNNAIYISIILILGVIILNLGCLHPVARVISYIMGFIPSTQRYYRRQQIYFCLKMVVRP
jgi:hypothetical protein